VCDDAGRKRKSSWEGLDAELRVCFPLTRSSGPGGLSVAHGMSPGCSGVRGTSR
jgi:hypothetical protein